jgi:hypothetical protein
VIESDSSRTLNALWVKIGDVAAENAAFALATSHAADVGSVLIVIAGLTSQD